MDPFNNRLLDLSSLRFLKADSKKPHPGAPGISTVDKTEGGCTWVPEAQSTPPGFSSPSLPPLVSSSTSSPLSPLPPNVPAAVAQLLLEFPDVVSCPQCFSPHQDSWSSSSLKILPLIGSKLQAARAEFDQMEKDGIVRCSTGLSTWCRRRMVPGGLAATFGG